MCGQWRQAAAGLLLMLALFLQALTAAADLDLLFFWLRLFFFIPLSLHTGRSVDRQIDTNITRRKRSGGILERSARPAALLVHPSVHPSISSQTFFWLNAAPPGDRLTLHRQPFRPHAVVALVSRWQSLGIEKGTLPFSAHLKTMAIRHILEPEISLPLYHKHSSRIQAKYGGSAAAQAAEL